MTDRFKTMLDQLNLSPSEFADRIGVQRSSISHILSGRNKPSIDFLEKILGVFPDVDVYWLITGKSSPMKTMAETKITKVELDRFNENDRSVKEKIKNPPLAFLSEPVDQIIIVYKNSTFRILKPSEA